MFDEPPSAGYDGVLTRVRAQKEAEKSSPRDVYVMANDNSAYNDVFQFAIPLEPESSSDVCV
jgi:hypothetical protein